MKRYLVLFVSLIALNGWAQPSSPPTQKADSLPRMEEINPQFPGGNFKLMQFLQTNLRYPPEALKAKVKGDVKVSFLVDWQGNISDIKIEKGLGYGCDEEVIRIVQLMPRWKPGISYGNREPVRVVMPVRFMVMETAK